MCASPGSECEHDASGRIGGLCLFAKRLEKGRFVWPRVEEGAIALTPAQLAMLIEGLDWQWAISFKDLPTPSGV